MERVESADGTPIAYERVGEGDPLICVHGTAAGRGSWRAVARALDGVGAALVDRRGRGESGDAPDHGLDREVADLLAVLDRVGPAAVLGHSFGGIVALEAARRTDAVRRLVLYEPPALAGDGGGFAADLRRLHEEEGGDAVVRAFFEAATGEPIDEAWPGWRGAAPPGRTIPREVAAVEAYELPGPAGVGVPALLLTGSESPPDLRASTAALADALSDPRVRRLDGYGHAANTRDPDLVAGIVGDFLRG